LRAGTDLIYHSLSTTYSSKLGHSLPLCEKPLEVQPTIDKELVSGGPVLRAKDSDVMSCFSFVATGHMVFKAADIWPIDPWGSFLSSPIRIWIHLLYDILNMSLKTILLGFRSSFPASCGPGVSLRHAHCPKLKLVTKNDNQLYFNIDDSDSPSRTGGFYGSRTFCIYSSSVRQGGVLGRPRV
jgi:hypothetical protein